MGLCRSKWSALLTLPALSLLWAGSGYAITQISVNGEDFAITPFRGLNIISVEPETRHTLEARLSDRSTLSLTTSSPDTNNSNKGFTSALGFQLTPKTKITASLGYNEQQAKTDLSHRQASLTSSTNASSPLPAIKTLHLLLNGTHNFDVSGPLKPYVSAGAGIGYGNVDTFTSFDHNTDTNPENDDWSVIYNVAGGLKYKMDDDLSLTGNYTFQGTQDLDFDQTRDDLSAHKFRVGLNYKLPLFWEE